MHVLDIVNTPNPNAVKVLLDAEVSPHTRSYHSPQSARDNPLAARLFAIPGVSGVMILTSFITVTKRPEIPWDSLLPAIQDALEE